MHIKSITYKFTTTCFPWKLYTLAGFEPGSSVTYIYLVSLNIYKNFSVKFHFMTINNTGFKLILVDFGASFGGLLIVRVTGYLF
jgi:hypothetical protein